MYIFKRYLFQVLFWLVVWCLVWISVDLEVRFIRANGLSIVLQVFLLFVVIYYAVPKFLLKKKYIYFLLSIVSLILLATYIGTVLGPDPIRRASSVPIGQRPPIMASRSFRQLLMMAIPCLSAILVETFAYAQQKEKGEILSRMELVKSELRFLKMQINPHFLFNALNNIYALSVTNSEKTQEGISTLSLMLRYVLYDCEQPKVPLRKELAYITNFIELFKLKSSETFNITFIEEVEDAERMVPPMLFVPFIENAFKHSGIEKRGTSFVNIYLKSKENIIEFSVENSLASEAQVKDEQGGIGLQNVKKRLDILYPQTHQLDITRADTFKVYLKMKLK